MLQIKLSLETNFEIKNEEICHFLPNHRGNNVMEIPLQDFSDSLR